MLNRLADLVAVRPKRTLAAVLVFAMLAAAVGGSVFGALEDSGGFTPASSEAARAADRIEAATGTQSAAGVVLLVTPEQGVRSPAARTQVLRLERGLASDPGRRLDGVAGVERRPRVRIEGRAHHLCGRHGEVPR
jgi:uncharacterized membrane protein YdfJ with MMPL/SSD domain